MDYNQLNELSSAIIGAAIEVHKQLGPGLLESSYQSALMFEIRSKGLDVQSEVEIPLIYKGVKMGTAYRADLIVENEVIVELKATENLTPVFAKQLYTYLRISNKKLGLLINFNEERLIDGLKRIIN